MNFQKGRHREDPEINLIPMIDVLLVILIFLMVTTTYTRYTSLQINLPQAAGDEHKEIPAVIQVAVDSIGRYTVDQIPASFVDPESFAEVLKQAVGDRKDVVLTISADAQATHQSVVNVMESARRAGIAHVTFTTQGTQNR
jgi:biopolymer transport protein ExbD